MCSSQSSGDTASGRNKAGPGTLASRAHTEDKGTPSTSQRSSLCQAGYPEDTEAPVAEEAASVWVQIQGEQRTRQWHRVCGAALQSCDSWGRMQVIVLPHPLPSSTSFQAPSTCTRQHPWEPLGHGITLLPWTRVVLDS